MLKREPVSSVGFLIECHALYDTGNIVPVQITFLCQSSADRIDRHIDPVALLFHGFLLELESFLNIFCITGKDIIADLFEGETNLFESNDLLQYLKRRLVIKTVISFRIISGL